MFLIVYDFTNHVLVGHIFYTILLNNNIIFILFVKLPRIIEVGARSGVNTTVVIMSQLNQCTYVPIMRLTDNVLSSFFCFCN